MEVPAPFGGKLVSLTVKVGDKVSQGSVIATVETQAPRWLLLLHRQKPLLRQR